MEYTKGEWKANKNYMGTWTIHTDETHIADVDRHFNAHLMAAAPDLYEALKGISHAFENWGTSAFMAYMYKSQIQIKEALAKAEGK